MIVANHIFNTRQFLAHYIAMCPVTESTANAELQPSPNPDAASNNKSGIRPQSPVPNKQVEVGGRDGLDPTRYGDWEKAGRCIDF